MNLLLHPNPATSEKFLSLLGIPAALTTVDEVGFTLFANNALTREFYGAMPLGDGVKLEVESVKAILDGERDPAALKAYVAQMKRNYQAVVDSNASISTESEILLPNGTIKWARNTLTPVHDEASRVARILITFFDVSELYKARLEIEDSLNSLISQAVTVCSACNKIAEGDKWLTMADYMKAHSEQQFTHGICKICRDRYFGVSS